MNALIPYIKDAGDGVAPDYEVGQAILQLEVALDEGVYSEVRNAAGELSEIRVTDSNGVVRHEYLMGSLEQGVTTENFYDAQGHLTVRQTRDK